MQAATVFAPDAVLVGHSGSTSAHPIIAEVSLAIRAACPDAWIVYGGVFPTDHWKEILQDKPQVDVIAPGEGERTAPRLIHALETGEALGAIPGIGYRNNAYALAARMLSSRSCLGLMVTEHGAKEHKTRIRAYRCRLRRLRRNRVRA